MPSRKKLKGKVRRAAKEAKEKEVEQRVVVGNQDDLLEAQMRRLTINNLNLLRKSDALQQCRHGFELEGHEERICFEFVNACFSLHLCGMI